MYDVREYPAFEADVLHRVDMALMRVPLDAGDPENGPRCSTCKVYGHSHECPILRASWTLCMDTSERVLSMSDLIEVVAFAEHFRLTAL